MVFATSRSYRYAKHRVVALAALVVILGWSLLARAAHDELRRGIPPVIEQVIALPDGSAYLRGQEIRSTEAPDLTYGRVQLQKEVVVRVSPKGDVEHLSPLGDPSILAIAASPGRTDLWAVARDLWLYHLDTNSWARIAKVGKRHEDLMPRLSAWGADGAITFRYVHAGQDGAISDGVEILFVRASGELTRVALPTVDADHSVGVRGGPLSDTVGGFWILLEVDARTGGNTEEWILANWNEGRWFIATSGRPLLEWTEVAGALPIRPFGRGQILFADESGAYLANDKALVHVSPRIARVEEIALRPIPETGYPPSVFAAVWDASTSSLILGHAVVAELAVDRFDRDGKRQSIARIPSSSDLGTEVPLSYRQEPALAMANGHVWICSQDRITHLSPNGETTTFASDELASYRRARRMEKVGETALSIGLGVALTVPTSSLLMSRLTGDAFVRDTTRVAAGAAGYTAAILLFDEPTLPFGPYGGLWPVLAKGVSTTAVAAAGTGTATWGCGEAAFGGSARPWQGLGGSMVGAVGGIVIGAILMASIESVMPPSRRENWDYLRLSIMAGMAAAGADFGYQLARGRP